MFEIGNTLREARLRRSLDIADCEAGTKIRAKYLRALEEEQFEVLPGGTYIRGFLRTYAEFLELDGRLVLDEFESRFVSRSDRPGHDPESARRRANRRRSREGRMLAISATVVLVAATGLWVGFADDGGDEPPPAPAAADLTAVFTATGNRPTYLEVRQEGPSGATLFTPASIPPGEGKEVTAKPPIWVHVGDGSGLRVTVDGDAVTTPKGKTEFRILAGGAIDPPAAR